MCGHAISRKMALRFAREMFPATMYGRQYSSYESLRRNDRIAANDLLDHIQYGETMTPSEGERFAGYCPRCNGGLFLKGGRHLCPNCGFERAARGFHGTVKRKHNKGNQIGIHFPNIRVKI